MNRKVIMQLLKRISLMAKYTALNLILLCLPGCNYIFENEFSKTDRTRDAVIEALNEKDKEKLQKLFSTDAINNSERYKAGEEYLFSIYDGKCESIEQTDRGSSGYTSKEGREISVSVIYRVSFDNREYDLFLYDFPINTLNKDKEGLYSLALLPIEEAEACNDYLARKAGIYYPGWEN